MADLIDRLAGSDPTRPKLPAHQFSACMKLYADGKMTRAEAAQDWDLQGQELTDATAIADAIDAAGGAVAKIVLCLRLEAIAELIEQGYPDDTVYHNPDGSLNKTRIKADIGF